MEDPYGGAMFTGTLRPLEAARSSMRAPQALAMTAPKQDYIGCARLSHHGTDPRPDLWYVPARVPRVGVGLSACPHVKPLT